MKKISILLIITICINLSLFANNDSDNSYHRAKILIEENLNGNITEIQKISSYLSENQKRQLLRKYEQDFTAPLLLNVFLPFAIGSFSQGDISGGLIGMAGDLTGISLITIGYFGIISNMVYDNNNDLSPFLSPEKCTILMVSGCIVSLISGIYQIIRPISYTKNYNKALNNAIRYNGDYSINVIPGIGLTSTGDAAPSISFKFSF